LEIKPMTSHIHRRIRHTVVFRTLEVKRVQQLTPHMQRIVFGGEDLRGFVSAAPDDHVKLFFPNRDGDIVTPVMGPNGPEYPAGRDYSPMRDYTPRLYDEKLNELTIDFVLHGDGPASTWAAQASPGQQIAAGGPKGSFLIADDFDTYVLVGDETALPAISRWLEEIPQSARVEVLAEIPHADDRQSLRSPAQFNVTWLERNGTPADQSDLLERALRNLSTPTGDTFYWIATESNRARTMRQWLSEERGVPKDWLKAKGYWKAGANENDEDD
jgi:NADPH-dependent ferric siderophore reductase